MAEVDWAEWAIEAADGFRETKWQNIGVALRQLAHELIDTRARLTTAETERDQAMWDKQDHWNARLAAEARVEAAERVMRDVENELRFRAATTNDIGQIAPPYTAHSLLSMADELRAALACPPTEEEK